MSKRYFYVSSETSLLVVPREIISKISHLANTGYNSSLFRRRFNLSSRAQKCGNRREFPEFYSTELIAQEWVNNTEIVWTADLS